MYHSDVRRLVRSEFHARSVSEERRDNRSRIWWWILLFPFVRTGKITMRCDACLMRPFSMPMRSNSTLSLGTSLASILDIENSWKVVSSYEDARCEERRFPLSHASNDGKNHEMYLTHHRPSRLPFLSKLVPKPIEVNNILSVSHDIRRRTRLLSDGRDALRRSIRSPSINLEACCKLHMRFVHNT